MSPVLLRDLPAERLDTWREGVIGRWRDRRAEQCGVSADEAERYVARTINAMTNTDRARSIVVDVTLDDQDVGTCWMLLESRGPRVDALVVDCDLAESAWSVMADIHRELGAIAATTGATSWAIRVANDASRRLAEVAPARRMSTRMIKVIGPNDDAIPVVVELVPMGESEFEVFFEHLVTSYAADIAVAGSLEDDEALAASRQQSESLLSDGVATAHHHLFSVRAGDVDVGILWLFEDPDTDDHRGFVYDIEMRDAERGRGYGRAVMLEAERFLRHRAGRYMELNVFGSNDRARGLYLSMGYVVAEDFFEVGT